MKREIAFSSLYIIESLPKINKKYRIYNKNICVTDILPLTYNTIFNDNYDYFVIIFTETEGLVDKGYKSVVVGINK